MKLIVNAFKIVVKTKPFYINNTVSDNNIINKKSKL